MRPRPRNALLPLVLVLVTGAACDHAAPRRPGHEASGKTVIVEAANPGGGDQSTLATSDLSVPPREGDLGWWPSLALDANGVPHLSYTDAFNGELHYAVWNGHGFDVTKVDTYGAVGKYTALAIGPGGRPNILYYNQDKKRLLYATYVGKDKVDPKDHRTPYLAAPGWMFEMVDEGTEIGMASKLSVDPDGTLVAFYYANDERLIEAWRPPTPVGVHAQWQHRTVDAHAGGSHSIVLGYARSKDGTRHLSYSNWTVFDSELRYATLAPGAKKWKVEAVTKKDNAGWKSGLVLDGAGRPVIVFLALLKRQLRIARPGKTKGTWKVEPLVDNANSMALARTKAGRLVLAYEHLPERGLGGATVRYLERPNLSGDLVKGWKRFDVPQAHMASYLVLALHPDGDPDIGWYDGGIRGVRLYSRAPLPTVAAKAPGAPSPPPAKPPHAGKTAPRPKTPHPKAPATPAPKKAAR